jgi:hypothetical protein
MIRLFAVVFGFFFALAGATAADELAQRTEGARAAVAAFGEKLRGELIAALEAGGPPRAIEVCNLKAPGIADEISKKQGWRVARTSLKVRNPANAPDAWEKAVLEKFEARKAAGEDPAKIEHAEFATEGGKKVFRYMKAIPTAEKPCLACHGSVIAPEAAAVIARHYPNDQARGFKAGDIRGAFTVVQPVN